MTYEEWGEKAATGYGGPGVAFVYADWTADRETWRKNCKECNTIRNALSEAYEADKRAIEAELAKFRQAVGLATTAVPDMVMNADDPIGMMHRVVAQRDKLAERMRQLEETLKRIAGAGMTVTAYHLSLQARAALEEEKKE